MVGVAFLVQGEGEVISAEGVHLLIEHEVGEGIGVPDMRLVTLEVEDLGVEVRGRVDTPLHSQEPQRIWSAIWHMGPGGQMDPEGSIRTKEGYAHAMLL